MLKLKGKTVLITGASSGIGLALAQEFASRGADLILLARREDRLKALSEKLVTQGIRVVALQCDVTQEGQLEKAVSQALLTVGRIDIVVANAGFSVWGGVARLKLEDYRRQFETNVFGVLRTLYSTLPELKERRGTFVILGSVSGYIPLPHVSAYSMSKSAVHALAHSIRPELKREGVSVVLIAPGFIKSEIRKVDNQGVYKENARDPVPFQLQMSAETAARKIVHAILAKKSEEVITVHGKILVFFKRHFPWIIEALVRTGILGKAASRSEKQKTESSPTNIHSKKNM